jgi:hypothetical protein
METTNFKIFGLQPNTPTLQYSILLLKLLFPLDNCTFTVQNPCQCKEIAHECLNSLLNKDFYCETV